VETGNSEGIGKRVSIYFHVSFQNRSILNLIIDSVQLSSRLSEGTTSELQNSSLCTFESFHLFLRIGTDADGILERRSLLLPKSSPLIYRKILEELVQNLSDLSYLSREQNSLSQHDS